MAVGSTWAKRVQIGKEVTRGTAVAATAVLLPDAGGFRFKPNILKHKPIDERFSQAAHHRSDVIAVESIDWTFSGDALYQQIMYWFDAVIKPAAISGAGPYVWTWLPTYSASNAQRTFTIEYGDDLQGYESEMAYAKSMSLSGGANAPVKLQVQGAGRQMLPVTFTPALTAPTVETIMGNDTQFFYAASWAALIGGGTEAPATLVDWQLNFDSGLMHGKRADGTAYYSVIGEKKRVLMSYRFTLEFNTLVNTTLDLYGDALAGTKQFFEIRCTGTSPNVLKMQFGAPIDNYEPLAGTDNGTNTVIISGETEYDATGATEGQVILTNSVATLP